MMKTKFSLKVNNKDILLLNAIYIYIYIYIYIILYYNIYIIYMTKNLAYIACNVI